VPPLRYVSAQTIRSLFNDGRYAELVEHGVLHEALIREGPPSISSNQPSGTRSQVVAYKDDKGKQVAIIHRYMRADGSLGGSGRPDPKKLLHNGTLYVMSEDISD
jgi:hypothetical protein